MRRPLVNGVKKLLDRLGTTLRLADDLDPRVQLVKRIYITTRGRTFSLSVLEHHPVTPNLLASFWVKLRKKTPDLTLDWTYKASEEDLW